VQIASSGEGSSGNGRKKTNIPVAETVKKPENRIIGNGINRFLNIVKAEHKISKK